MRDTDINPEASSLSPNNLSALEKDSEIKEDKESIMRKKELAKDEIEKLTFETSGIRGDIDYLQDQLKEYQELLSIKKDGLRFDFEYLKRLPFYDSKFVGYGEGIYRRYLPEIVELWNGGKIQEEISNQKKEILDKISQIESGAVEPEQDEVFKLNYKLKQLDEKLKSHELIYNTYFNRDNLPEIKEFLSKYYGASKYGADEDMEGRSLKDFLEREGNGFLELKIDNVNEKIKDAELKKKMNEDKIKELEEFLNRESISE